jgi:hypothetical protein
MLLTLLLACGGPTDGTWLFTRTLTLPGTPTCASDVTHNLIGGVVPTSETTEDTAWVETETGAVSDEAFFARISTTAEGAVMVVGEEVLVGRAQDDGTWAFAWTATEDTRSDAAHATGYRFANTAAASRTLRMSGSFTGGTFEGSWDEESTSTESWSETDTWTADAEPHAGASGRTPFSLYLLKDDGAGNLSTPSNGRDTFDCGAGSAAGTNGCALAVSTNCAYRTTLSGTLTDLAPGDEGWVGDAGQSAGL